MMKKSRRILMILSLSFAISLRHTQNVNALCPGNPTSHVHYPHLHSSMRSSPIPKINQLTPCAPLLVSRRFLSLHADSSTTGAKTSDRPIENEKLPSTITPILLSVLALIVSEGIALSTLPLHMQSMGATPALVGLSTSAFSIAQMVCCPLIISLSSRTSRRKTLGLCLFGAALSSTAIAAANSVILIIGARFLAGVFAAAIPVAQAGVADLVPEHQMALALSRVSAASQTGLVIGPIASAVIQGLLTRFGVPAKYNVRGVFAASAVFALFALALGGAGTDSSSGSGSSSSSREISTKVDNTETKTKESILSIPKSAAGSTSSLPLAREISRNPEYAQPLLRVVALAAGWALTLSVSTYSLFSSRFMGYGQSQLSASMSAGAATTIATQIFVVPRLVQSVGEHLSCTIGLWALTLGLVGTSLVRGLPLHAIFYLLIRIGTGITDTSTATLVARSSDGQEERARNLGMVQSTRAGARIFTPVVSGSLFSRSCLQRFPLPGSLPYLVNAGLAFALTPLPLVLKRMERKLRAEGSGVYGMTSK